MGRHCSGTAACGLRRTPVDPRPWRRGCRLATNRGPVPWQMSSRAPPAARRPAIESPLFPVSRLQVAGGREGRAGGCGERPSGLRPGGHPYGARRDPRWIQSKDNGRPFVLDVLRRCRPRSSGCARKPGSGTSCFTPRDTSRDTGSSSPVRRCSLGVLANRRVSRPSPLLGGCPRTRAVRPGGAARCGGVGARA